MMLTNCHRPSPAAKTYNLYDTSRDSHYFLDIYFEEEDKTTTVIRSSRVGQGLRHWSDTSHRNRRRRMVRLMRLRPGIYRTIKSVSCFFPLLTNEHKQTIHKSKSVLSAEGGNLFLYVFTMPSRKATSKPQTRQS